MLQLVAAWDSLASRLPAGPGAGANAEVLVNAIKIILAHAPSDRTARALSLASRLAELAGAGLPIDVDSIAAGILAEAFPRGLPLPDDAVAQRLGPAVAALLSDVAKVSRLPARIDLYDDGAAAALRELCLNFYDVRATAVEVVSRLHALHRAARTPGVHAAAEGPVLALEALQIYAPMGHALGLGGVSAELEDLCFRTLFPASYERTTQWLRRHADVNGATLRAAEEALLAAVAGAPEFQRLAGGLEVEGRTKSPFSTLKKLLRLGDIARGGRARSEIYDLLGLRAVVVPRRDLPPAEAEAAAVEACYLVEAAAQQLWRTVEGRSKDYIASPKANGYQSLHSTVLLEGERGAGGGEAAAAGAEGQQAPTLELQIRTQGEYIHILISGIRLLLTPHTPWIT